MTTEDPYEPPAAPLAPSSQRDRLEPKKIIAAALVFVAEKRLALAKALLMPFLLYAAVEFAYRHTSNAFVVMLLGLAQVFLQTIIAITTHRLILLGEKSVPEWGIRTWSRRETYFLLHVIAVALIWIPLVGLAFIPVIGWLAMLCVGAWLMSRISLVFPAIAIDQGVTFPLAWRLSMRHQGPLVITIAIFPIVIGLPAGLLSLVPMTAIPVTVLDSLVTVFTVAALSISYREVQRIEYGRPAFAPKME